MQPKFDPKTSPNSPSAGHAVAFQDRLYVAGNASFLCLAIAVIWSEFFIVRGQFSIALLFALAAPLVATGATVLIVGMSRSMVPRPVLSSPLQFTIPLIWCLICYLAMTLISTQETSSMSVPDQLLPGLAWLRPVNLIPVCLLQVSILGLFVFFERSRERV